MNIIICDDSASDRASLKEFIKAYTGAHFIDTRVSEATNADELMLLCPTVEARSTVIFLDIFMQGETGMAAAVKLRNKGFDGIIVFTTTSRDFAVDSYVVSASDYLLKPFEYERFALSMKRCEDKLSETSRLLTLSAGKSNFSIPLADIIYFETGSHCVLVHTRSEVVRIPVPLSAVKQHLVNESGFLQCHRSYIININMVEKVENTHIVMKDGSSVLLNVREASKLRRDIAEFFWKRTSGGKTS